MKTLTKKQSDALIEVATRAGSFEATFDKRTLNALERRRLVKRRQHHFHWEWYLTQEGATLALQLALDAGSVDTQSYYELLTRALRHVEDDAPRAQSVAALRRALDAQQTESA